MTPPPPPARGPGAGGGPPAGADRPPAGDDDAAELDVDLDTATREHYEDAALYDFEYRRRRADVNHYRWLAREVATRTLDAGPATDGFDILELGCGTGRLLTPLARDGHRVLGLDAAHPMLVRAAARIAHLPRAAQARAAVLRGDMRRFALDARFPLIVAPFNVLQHLYGRGDVEACLERVRAHLPPRGRFAFDVLHPDLRWLTRDPRRRWARTRFRHPTTGERVEYSTNEIYDPVAQIVLMRIYYEPLEPAPGRRRQVVRLAHRQFFPAELEALLHYNGFVIERRWGGFAGEELTGASESQVLLCKPR